jgi:hypothetical protein
MDDAQLEDPYEIDEAKEVGLFAGYWNKWTSKVNILVEDNDKIDSLRK